MCKDKPMKLHVTYLENGCKILANTYKNSVAGNKRANKLRSELAAKGLTASIERKS